MKKIKNQIKNYKNGQCQEMTSPKQAKLSMILGVVSLRLKQVMMINMIDLSDVKKLKLINHIDNKKVIKDDAINRLKEFMLPQKR